MVRKSSRKRRTERKGAHSQQPSWAAANDTYTPALLTVGFLCVIHKLELVIALIYFTDKYALGSIFVVP